MHRLMAVFSTTVLFFVTQPAIADEVAQLDSAVGLVEVMSTGQKAFKPVTVGAKLNAYDVIHIGEGGKAGILLTDGSLIRLAENSSLTFKPKNAGQRGRPLEMTEGKGFFFSREPKEAPIVNTPSATTAIRGTEFAIEVSAEETIVSVLDGAVACSNQFGSVDLGNGEEAHARKGSAPVKSILVQPLNAVQWALYYPVVLVPSDIAGSFSNLSSAESQAFKDLSDGKSPALGGLRSDSVATKVIHAFASYKDGETNKASKILSKLPVDAPVGARLLETAIALSQGNVKLAEMRLSELEHRLGLSANESALIAAQNSIVALVLNRNHEALSYVEEAGRIAPESPSVALAKSYVYQGNLRLEEAKAVLEKYTVSSPHDAFALARLAEIELGFGHLRKAVSLAEKSTELDGDNWYGLSVLGFSKLLVNDTAEAIEYFNRAIKIDSIATLPRLGKGLAKIHQGHLDEGKDEIAKAVYLAPNVAIYRSYLGKAFFEEEREHLALHEYNRAMALDAKDPTPYLYRAYSKLSANRPVLALKDVEKSIQLNENRAVYRSSFLLDQDLAVRSASLSETFNALGFSEIARVEAIKSLSHDYGNYSAHLLLSEAYQSILTNDASVSERKIADLLAPPSFNLFQKQAGSASVNEYNALYDRPEARTELSLDTSSYNDQLGAGALYAKKGQDYGFVLGYKPLWTGGSKSNDFSRRERAFVSSEYQPNFGQRISVDGKAIYDNGRNLDGEPTDTRFETYEGSVGLFQELGAHSKVIADISYSRDNHRLGTRALERSITHPSVFEGDTFTDENYALINEVAREQIDSLRTGAQHIFDSEYVSSVTGFQFYRSEVERNEDSSLLEDELEIFTDLEYFLQSHEANILGAEDAYHYSTFHIDDWIHLTSGATYSHVEVEDREVTPFVDATHSYSRLNPKAGVLINASKSTTLRGAYFATLRKSSLEDNLSIEPTIVSGINQRFTDFSGARSRNLGFGIDQKFETGTYVGAEAIRRHVIDDSRDVNTAIEVDYDEGVLSKPTVVLGDTFHNHKTHDVYRGYLYQIVSDSVAVSGDYEWTELRRTDPEILQEVNNQKAKASLRYFEENGFFPYMNATWRSQDRNGGDFIADGSSEFAIVDVGVGYRVPRRHGAIVFQLSNIFDKEFTYDQSFGTEPFLNSGIGASVVASVNF